MTRALVIGGGSIGSRHASVLMDLGHNVAFVSRRNNLDALTFPSLQHALGEFTPGYVVIATESSMHEAAVADLRALDYTGVLLIEKPMLVDAATLDAAPFARIGVGFNLRFHPVIAGLKSLLASTRVLTVEVYAGQHLSGWRPSRPVAEQYSSVRARGGGVLRDLSHEFDYLGFLLGHCEGVFARGGRLGTITIDSDDAWGIVARYERSPLATIQLNYFDRNTRRRIVINTTESTIEADLVASTLRVDDRVEQLPTDRDLTYRAMHRAMLDGSDVSFATVEQAADTDHLVRMIERSAITNSWVESL